MKHLLLATLLLLTGLAPAQLTPGAVSGRAANSTLSNVDPITGAVALRSPHLVNSQPRVAAKVSTWTGGGGGSAPPVRKFDFGDSLAAFGGGIGPGPKMGLAGIIGLTSYNRTGTVTQHQIPSDSRMDYWINGAAITYAVGATGEYTVGGLATGDLRGDRACIGFIKGPGRGTFEFQYQTNGTGAWTTLATINTSNGTTVGDFDEYNLPTSTSPFYRLRVANVTVGDVTVTPVVGVYNSNGGGVIYITSGIAGGLDISAANTTPSAVFAPIWTGLAPDCVFSLWADAAADWETGGAFDVFYDAATAAYAATDWILISRNPSYEAYAGTEPDWATATPYALNAEVYSTNGSSVAAVFRCILAHTSDAASRPGIGASTATYWTQIYSVSAEAASVGFARDQAAAQYAWARENNQSFFDGHELFGGSWSVANANGLVADVVHPSTPGAQLRNRILWSTISLGQWDLGGVSGLANAAAISGAMNSQPVEWDRAIDVRGSSASIGFYDQAALYDGSRLFRVSNSGRKLNFNMGSTPGLAINLAIDGTAAVLPGFNNLPLGSTALRWGSVFMGGASAGITTKTAAYTATSTDHTILGDATTAAFTITLPAAASHSGRILAAKKIDASGNAVTVDGNGSETIDGATTITLTAQWDHAQIQSNGTAWFRID